VFETCFVFGLLAYPLLVGVPDAMWQLLFGSLLALVGLLGGGLSSFPGRQRTPIGVL
jgi:hypothetical protein